MRFRATSAALATAAALFGGTALTSLVHAESATMVPAPALHAADKAVGRQTAVLAGGCFWGVQAVFQHVKGVTLAQSGYTGGTKTGPSYEDVSSGETGHAESVKIEYDPAQISYGQILQVYFSVAHNPTELDAQGPDEGTQYRSDIFASTPDQRAEATAYIAQIDAAHIFRKPIVTRVDTLGPFFPAEGYHQDFALRNPGHPYIMVNDAPKVANLKRLFPDLYRDKPEGLAAASL